MSKLSRLIRTTIFALSTLITSMAYVQAAVPTPIVSTPPSGSHGFPFSSSGLDLSAYGYVEEEFFIAGTAQAYTNAGAFALDGKWTAIPNPGVTASYKTRLLVRRPSNSRFNGTVIVEWLNVSSGMEGSPDWTFTHAELLREGYAYVGVSAQYIGVAFNQQWDPSRYSTLTHPGDSFSYDIFAQAAKAVSRPAMGGIKPLGNLTSRLRVVIADGESQSASRLWTYYNAIHPDNKVFDGFFIHSIGSGAALSQSYAAIAFGSSGVQIVPIPAGVPATPDVAVPGGAGAVIRSDQNEPVLFLNSETDVSGVFGFPGLHSQQDSAVFRLWEVAGTSHGDKYLLEAGAIDATKSGVSFPLDCGIPPINDGPHKYAVRAAVHALNKWVGNGIPAPIGPRFSLVNNVLARDSATGIVTSGIKLPQLAIPIKTLSGTRPLGALAANPFCVLFGAADPWNGDRDPWDGVAGFDPSPTPEPDPRVLYQSKGEYLLKYTRALVSSVIHGFVRPRDMKEVYDEAASADL